MGWEILNYFGGGREWQKFSFSHSYSFTVVTIVPVFNSISLKFWFRIPIYFIIWSKNEITIKENWMNFSLSIKFFELIINIKGRHMFLAQLRYFCAVQKTKDFVLIFINTPQARVRPERRQWSVCFCYKYTFLLWWYLP